MAQAIISSGQEFNDLIGLYKSWYTDEELNTLIARSSPVARALKKKRIGGKEYRFAALAGRNTAVAGDYTVALAQASSGGPVAEFVVPPGKMFTAFTMTLLERLASRGQKAVFLDAAVTKMAGSTESIRRMFATSLYSGGYGEVGFVPTGGIANAATTATLPAWMALKLDVNSFFDVWLNALPGTGTLDNGTGAGYKVTAIGAPTANGVVITFTPGVQNGAGWTAGWPIVFHGSADASSNPNLPTGLGGVMGNGWLPWLGDRTGGTWNTLIGATFYNMNRSTNVNALSGQFYKRAGTYGNAGSDSYLTAFIQLLRMCRRGGGVPNIVAVNDADFFVFLTEANAQTTYFQMINTAESKKQKPEVIRGLDDLKFAFNSSFLGTVYDDPWCPQGIGYVLDDEAVKFVSLGNEQEASSPQVEGNNPGSQMPSSFQATPEEFKLVIDDWISVIPNTSSPDGPAQTVALSIFGNWVCYAPAHCGVVDLANVINN